MVWQVIGDILPLAAGAAIAVMPMIAVVVMLTSAGGKTKAIATDLGWLTGAFGFTALLALLGNEAEISDEPGQPSVAGSLLQFALGVVLLALAARQFRGRPKPGQDVEAPAWLTKLDDLSPLVLFVAGALLSFGNLKNIVLLPSAAVTISRGDLGTLEVLLASLVFAIVASLGMAAPLILSLARGERAAPLLTALRDWLTRNSAVILAVLFLMLGWNMMGKGIGGLFA